MRGIAQQQYSLGFMVATAYSTFALAKRSWFQVGLRRGKTLGRLEMKLCNQPEEESQRDGGVSSKRKRSANALESSAPRHTAQDARIPIKQVVPTMCVTVGGVP